MKSLGMLLVMVGCAMAVLLVAGCEFSGNYHDDNTTVQFGNTNSATQTNTN